MTEVAQLVHSQRLSCKIVNLEHCLVQPRVTVGWWLAIGHDASIHEVYHRLYKPNPIIVVIIISFQQDVYNLALKLSQYQYQSDTTKLQMIHTLLFGSVGC